MINRKETRRTFLRKSGPAAGLGLTAGLQGRHSSRPDESSGKPDTVYILIEDLGYAEPGCYGNTFCETPDID